MPLETNSQIKKAIRNGNLEPVVALFKTQRGEHLIATPHQMEIIERLIIGEPKYISVNMYTGYGKSDAVSIGIILSSIINDGEKNYILGPTFPAAKVLNDYVGRHFGDHSFFMEFLSSGQTEQQLWKEKSKWRRTLKNNSSIQVMSCDVPKMGESLWGEGTDWGKIVSDETERTPVTIIEESVLRMRRSEDAQIILIGNPLSRGYIYETLHRPELVSKYLHIHVDDTIGIDEKRHTEEFFKEKAIELGGEDSIGYKIKYKSIYPEEYEDTLIPFQKLSEALWLEPSGKIVERRMGCDPAHQGPDEATLIDVDVYDSGFYDASNLQAWKTTSVPEMIGIIEQRYSLKPHYTAINVDYQTLQGVVDGLKENKKIRRFVNGIKHGENARGKNKYGEEYKNLFVNTKSRNYSHLSELFIQGMIRIPNDQKLKEQLMGFTLSHRPNGKIFIIDPPGKSPDRADALVYACAPVRMHIPLFSGRARI